MFATPRFRTYIHTVWFTRWQSGKLQPELGGEQSRQKKRCVYDDDTYFCMAANNRRHFAGADDASAPHSPSFYCAVVWCALHHASSWLFHLSRIMLLKKWLRFKRLEVYVGEGKANAGLFTNAVDCANANTN